MKHTAFSLFLMLIVTSTLWAGGRVKITYIDGRGNAVDTVPLKGSGVEQFRIVWDADGWSGSYYEWTWSISGATVVQNNGTVVLATLDASTPGTTEIRAECTVRYKDKDGIPRTVAAAGDTLTFIMFKISHETAIAAPEGGKKRTTVGLKEDVLFTSTHAMDSWTQTGGSGNGAGAAYTWTAPTSPGAGKVTASLRGATAETDLAAIAPSAYIYTVESFEGDGNPNTAGGRVEYTVRALPLSVCFLHVQWVEQVAPAVADVGYFAGRAGPHNAAAGAEKPSDIDAENYTTGDTAAIEAMPDDPWRPGSFSWIIPTDWKCGANRLTVESVTQTFAITGDGNAAVAAAGDGDLTMTKKGAAGGPIPAVQ